MVEKIDKNIEGNAIGEDLSNLRRQVEDKNKIEGPKDPLEISRKELKSWATSILDSATFEFDEEGKMTAESKDNKQNEIKKFSQRLQDFKKETEILLKDMAKKYKCDFYHELKDKTLKPEDLNKYEIYQAIMNRVPEMISENIYFSGSLEILTKEEFKDKQRAYMRQVKKFFFDITPIEFIDDDKDVLDEGVNN